MPPRNYAEYMARFPGPDDDAFPAADYARDVMDASFDDYSPCYDCPHRDGAFCAFYHEDLDEIDVDFYIPCPQCDQDFSDE